MTLSRAFLPCTAKRATSRTKRVGSRFRRTGKPHFARHISCLLVPARCLVYAPFGKLLEHGPPRRHTRPCLADGSCTHRYKVPLDYGLLQLNLDTVDWILKFPELASIGGNTGTVNSFAGVELTDLTSGVLNLPKLLESNNLLCFVLEIVKLASPTYLSNLYATLVSCWATRPSDCLSTMLCC